MRYDFDAYLLRLAGEAGVSMKLGASISEIDLENRVVTLNSGDCLKFAFLIGADGANSQVAKHIFGKSFNTKTIGFGLEVEVTQEQLPLQPDIVEIDFAGARWGYGWVFPKHKSFTIGVGGIHTLNPDLREKLGKYLARKGINIFDIRVKGQFIPFGDYRTRPGAANALLCGDAAGLVDPITGEGIAYAMQSGCFAAKAIAEARRLGDPDRAFEIYLKDYKQITNAIWQANLWRRLIFPQKIQGLFAKGFSDASTLQKGFLDVLAGEKEYSDLYAIFLIQIEKGLQKLLRLLVPWPTPRRPPSRS